MVEKYKNPEQEDLLSFHIPILQILESQTSKHPSSSPIWDRFFHSLANSVFILLIPKIPSTPSPIATKTWRKIYSLLGFKKGYSFTLFFILVGALMGFILPRLKFLHHPTLLREAIPSDTIYYAFDTKKIGIRLHLFGILIRGFLACFQFVPVIRYKALVFHRMNGYVIIVLFLIAEVGAMMTIPKIAADDPAALTAFGSFGYFYDRLHLSGLSQRAKVAH